MSAYPLIDYVTHNAFTSCTHETHGKRWARKRAEKEGVLEEVKEECYDGGDREGSNIKCINTVFNVVCTNTCYLQVTLSWNV